MDILWNPEENKILLETRGICFEMVLEKIVQGDFIGPEINTKRENQYRIIVFFDDYPFVVPMVIDRDVSFT
jgi:hypothetical protein